MSPSTASGRVYLFDGATQVAGPEIVRGGQATLTVTTLRAGTHQLSTHWVSDLVTASAQSAPVPATVVPAATGVILTAQPTTPPPGWGPDPNTRWVRLTFEVQPALDGWFAVSYRACLDGSQPACAPVPYFPYWPTSAGPFIDMNGPGVTVYYSFAFHPTDDVDYLPSQSAWLKVVVPT